MSEGDDPPDINSVGIMDTDDVDKNQNDELQRQLLERQQNLTNFKFNSINFNDAIPPGFHFMQNPSVNLLKPTLNLTVKNDNVENVVPTISGADIYTTVLSKKRRRSPIARKIIKLPSKVQKPSKSTVMTKNRFSIFNLKNNSENIKNKEEKTLNEKPTPFYVRGEKNTSEIRKWMHELEITDYDIKVLFHGHEAKLQVNTIDEYRKIQTFFEKNKVTNYTYQLKSARSVRAVLKGLDPRIDSDEIKDALESLNFMPRNVFKPNNKNGDKSNVVIIELVPSDDNSKSHPIFDLKRLLNMVITVEEPKKNNQPKQCYNCQEYGHTKNRCFLTPICAICAAKHPTKECDKDKKDSSAKSCNNCGENHTANWKGCRVYQVLLERLNPKQRREQRIANNQHKRIFDTKKQIPESSVVKGISYANIVTGKVNNEKIDESFNSNDLIKLMFMMQANMQTLQSNISDIIKKQNTLENSIIDMNKMLCKICKQK